MTIMPLFVWLIGSVNGGSWVDIFLVVELVLKKWECERGLRVEDSVPRHAMAASVGLTRGLM